VMDLSQLLLFTQKAGASDLHLSAGALPMVRIHGEMRALEIPGRSAAPMTAEEVHSLVYDILTDTQRKTLESDLELDFAMSLGDVARFRANVYYQGRGEAAVFRVIPTKILDAETLGLTDAMLQLAHREQGLVIVTGPTGSGKSTTLAALVDVINRTRACHILTIEDPIEFVHSPKKSLVNQREVGPNTQSFANALRSALREDPDVILVGEMRDLETISLALTAAETGHLVFGTLHTMSASKTVDRIINVFPADEQEQVRNMFAGSIEGIIAQVLLKRIDQPGRIAAREVLLSTPAVKNMIRENKIHQMPTAIQTGVRLGMMSMDQSLTRLVMEKVVSREDAERFLRDSGTLGGGGAGGSDRPAGMSTPPPPAAEAPSAPARPARRGERRAAGGQSFTEFRRSSGARARKHNPYV
jgi:twitching motility protein PilT